MEQLQHTVSGYFPGQRGREVTKILGCLVLVALRWGVDEPLETCFSPTWVTLPNLVTLGQPCKHNYGDLPEKFDLSQGQGHSMSQGH